jgi:hypothetical protein
MCSLSQRKSRWCILCLLQGSSHHFQVTFTFQLWVKSRRSVRASKLLSRCLTKYRIST